MNNSAYLAIYEIQGVIALKRKTFRLLALMLIAMSLVCLNTNAAEYKNRTLSYKNSTAVRNYDQFYSALKKGITLKKSQVSVYIENYNQSTYNIDKAVKQVLESSFELKYTVSSYNAKITGTKGSKDRILNIYLKYISVDGTAKDYNQLLKVVENAAKSKKNKVRVKIKANNTTIIKNKLRVKEDLNKKLPANSRINNIVIRQSGFPKVNELLLEYSITYKDETKGSTVSSTNAKSYDDLYKAIKDSIYNCTPVINISIEDNYLNNNHQDIFNTISKVINEVLDEDLDINYLKGHKVQAITEGNISSISITFDYKYAKDKVVQQRAEVNKKADDIIKSIIKPDMTDFEKELSIHNYIINNAKYDYENSKKGTVPPESFTSYGVLVKGVGVCQSYALAMKKLLNLARVESIIVSGYGDGVLHAWNLVKIEGDYYHVDTTWDDPIYTENGIRKDVLRFDYFNLTDDEMSKGHKWDRSKYPVCDSAKYRYQGK